MVAYDKFQISERVSRTEYNITDYSDYYTVPLMFKYTSADTGGFLCKGVRLCSIGWKVEAVSFYAGPQYYSLKSKNQKKGTSFTDSSIGSVGIIDM